MNSNQSKIGTSATHWFVRGLASGLMLVAATNAISYFFRTASIADLIGRDQHVTESLGFPFEIWRENSLYHGSFFLDYLMVSLNLMVGLILGTAFGILAVHLRDHFNRWIREFEQKQSGHRSINFQFSVKSLLLMTTVAAGFVAALTNWNGTPEVLMAIYFLGPACLVLIAMIPNRIHWQHRIVILTATALAMIGIAISSGLSLEVPLDRVLLGIFVSWTPQSAFAAFLLTAILIFQLYFTDNARPEIGDA